MGRAAEPTNSALVGAAIGLAVVSKFSSLLFLPAAAITTLICWAIAEKPKLSIASVGREYARPLGLAATTMFLVIWAVYRFSFKAVSFAPFHMLFPELYEGVQQVIDHNRQGDPAFLLGNHSHSGWWYFYLVVLAVKTPLPFLALLICGIAIMKRAPGIRTPLAFSLGILFICMPSRINLGVRHILPVYIGFSIAAGAAELLRRRSSRAAAFLAILGVSMIATSALAHPDYLPYFNALGGKDPSRVLVDSDLDWGQDVKRLAARLREAGAKQVFFTPFAPADLAAQGLPPVQPNSHFGPSPGWNAVSLTVLRNMRFWLWDSHPEIHLWPDQVKPPEKIGKGIWLWYLPPTH